MNPTTLKVIEHQIAYKSCDFGHDYCSFPSAVATPEGEILVSFRRAKMRWPHISHIDVASHAVLLKSKDEGKTFSQTVVKHAEAEGIQDPSINRLSDGTLIATYFTWLVQKRALTIDRDNPAWIPHKADYLAQLGGVYSIRSEDNGETWDDEVLLSSERLALRGKGTELPNGDFLVATYNIEGTVFISLTSDKGKSWTPLSTITHPEGLSETSLFTTRSGKVLAFIRSKKCDHQDPLSTPLLTAESLDGGKTWSTPQPRPFYSFSPFEPHQLRNGRVLVTYGYRYAPYGIRAFFLDEECTQWEQAKEIILREDGLSFDIGYTSAVQLPNDDILIFYYYYGADQYRYIGYTRCREE